MSFIQEKSLTFLVLEVLRRYPGLVDVNHSSPLDGLLISMIAAPENRSIRISIPGEQDMSRGEQTEILLSSIIGLEYE